MGGRLSLANSQGQFWESIPSRGRSTFTHRQSWLSLLFLTIEELKRVCGQFMEFWSLTIPIQLRSFSITNFLPTAFTCQVLMFLESSRTKPSCRYLDYTKAKSRHLYVQGADVWKINQLWAIRSWIMPTLQLWRIDETWLICWTETMICDPAVLQYMRLAR